MPPLPVIKLKPYKDVPLKAGHPWVFSEAIAEDATIDSGELVQVWSHADVPLGIGTHNGKTSIRVRMLTHDVDEEINKDYFSNRFRALAEWKESRLPDNTNGYRLVHAEADGISGLIVDRYADTFVFQLHTAGMDRLRDVIIEALKETFSPKNIVERSDLEARKLEGLVDKPIQVHVGSVEAPVEFKEAGITFLADVLAGQKTGFFLDQRPTRIALQTYAKDKRVLNLFGYTGAFSVHAAKAGASFVNTVDLSRPALELAEKNIQANGFDAADEEKFSFVEGDVMDFIREKATPGGPYDVIVCDPPAFAKHGGQIPQAIKAYTDVNTACFRKLQKGGILITSSCSGRVDPEAFRALLKISAGRAERDVRLLEWIGHPIDHAERLAYPEGRYLKTAILEVTEVLEKK